MEMPSRKESLLLIVIVMLCTSVQIATDLYTPSLPAIANHFRVKMGRGQLTMTLFLVGLGVFNLLYGPLSEGIGRKKTLLIGVSIAVVGSFICYSAVSLHWVDSCREQAWLLVHPFGAASSVTRLIREISHAWGVWLFL